MWKSLLASVLAWLAGCGSAQTREERPSRPLSTEFWTFPSADANPIYPVRRLPVSESSNPRTETHHH